MELSEVVAVGQEREGGASKPIPANHIPEHCRPSSRMRLPGPTPDPAPSPDPESHARALLAALFTPCTACAPVQEAIRSLASRVGNSNGVRLMGTLHEPDPDIASMEKPQHLEGLTLECPNCRGTGVVPTMQGRRLLAFVAAFEGTEKQKQGPELLRDEIPF